MAKSYDVSAVPFEGFDSFNRAGRRWTTTPTTVTVSDTQLTDQEKEGLTDAQQADALRAKLGPDEITQAQYDALKNDARIRIYPSDSTQAQQARRLDELRTEMARTASETPTDDRTAARTATTQRTSRVAAGTTGATAGGGTGPTGGTEGR